MNQNPMWPFAAASYERGDDVIQTYHITVDDRIAAVKRMTDRATLEAALAVPNLQKTVERAIRARLKKTSAATDQRSQECIE